MIDQAVVDHKLLPQLTVEIEKKSGSEVAAWNASTESTNKVMELEKTKQKNKEKRSKAMIMTLLLGGSK